jgi:hypothetical protein
VATCSCDLGRQAPEQGAVAGVEESIIAVAGLRGGLNCNRAGGVLRQRIPESRKRESPPSCAHFAPHGRSCYCSQPSWRRSAPSFAAQCRLSLHPATGPPFVVLHVVRSKSLQTPTWCRGLERQRHNVIAPTAQLPLESRTLEALRGLSCCVRSVKDEGYLSLS